MAKQGTYGNYMGSEEMVTEMGGWGAIKAEFLTHPEIMGLEAAEQERRWKQNRAEVQEFLNVLSCIQMIVVR